MARSASSKRWLREHQTDPYVKQATAAGLRSRAACKLLAIDARDRLLRPGMRVVDLGAAPGGWTQVAAAAVGERGRVVACDRLAMEAVANTIFVRGDFAEPAVLQAVVDALGGAHADLVLSDMAPNISGIKAVDQPRALGLAELALDCAGRVLAPGGACLVKVFQGEGFDEFLRAMRARFARAAVRKPAASRGRSAESYVLGRGFGI